MTVQDVTDKLLALQSAIKDAMNVVSVFEGQLDHKEAQIKAAENRLASVHASLAEEQSKAGSYVSAASDEAAKLRNQAKELVESAKKQMEEAHAMKQQALAAVADAEIRTKKLQADERALTMQMQIFQRQKDALNKALRG